MKIKTIAQLREIYGQPGGRAAKKILPALEQHSIHFIEKSPFMLMATFSKDGALDVSPRRGSAGFVKVLDKKQILIPDFKGNNRIDSLMNILETGRIGTLFLIPGVDETLRVNGSAIISTDEQLLAQYSAEKHPPKTCLLIQVEEVFLHCAKALMRSQLWNPSIQIDRSQFPGMGEMMKDQLNLQEMAESQEEMVRRYSQEI